MPALIAGTTIPDITYFLNLRTVSNIGHSHIGILIQGIPAALCLLAVFAFVMLQPLRALSPRSLGRLLPTSYAFLPLRRFLVIVLSVYVGAWSHVFWDSFTHDGWFFVRNIPALDMQVGPLPVYKYLQYLSGIFGTLAVITWAVLVAKGRPAAPERIANRIMPVTIILSVLAITLYVALGKNNPLTPYIAVIQTTVGGIAGTFLGLLAFSLIDKIHPFTRTTIKA